MQEKTDKITLEIDAFVKQYNPVKKGKRLLYKTKEEDQKSGQFSGPSLWQKARSELASWHITTFEIMVRKVIEP